MKKIEAGLTLQELVIVAVIIVTLALIAIWYFRSQIFKGNDAKRKGDIHKIQVAVEEYEKDHNCYPLPQYVTCNPGTGLQPYIQKIPCDPSTKASYLYEPEGSNCPRWYRIYANLENSSDTDIGKLGCISGCGPNLAFNYYAASPNAPTPPQGGGSVSGTTGFYGCKNGVCTPISWDPSRPGPECDPNYQSSNCFNQCGQSMTECIPWR